MSVQIRPKQSSLAVKVDRNDHGSLSKRNLPDQHTIEAITGLTEALQDLNDLIIRLRAEVNTNDNSATEAIETLTANLTNLINDEVARASAAEEMLKAEAVRMDASLIELGNELSARVDEFQANKSELNTRITDEIERAKTEEVFLADKIQKECARAQVEEEKLAAATNAEVLRAQTEEAILFKNIDLEYQRAKDAEDELGKRIDSEASRVNLINTVLTNNILAETDRATKAEAKLAEDIAAETTRATEAEAAVTSELNTVKSTVENLEINIDTKLSQKADLVDGKIPDTQIPDIIKSNSIFEAETVAGFPATGVIGSLYVSTSDNIIYRWDGTAYVELSSAKFKEDTTIQIICEV